MHSMTESCDSIITNGASLFFSSAYTVIYVYIIQFYHYLFWIDLYVDMHFFLIKRKFSLNSDAWWSNCEYIFRFKSVFIFPSWTHNAILFR